MAGDISGLAETNVINTQLDTGHMDVTTIASAVKDSGAFDVTLAGDDQSDNNRMVVEEDSCDDTAKIRNVGEMHKTTKATNVTLEDDERGQGNPVEVEDGIGHGAGINNKTKCSQVTQTELSTISSPKHEPVYATGL